MKRTAFLVPVLIAVVALAAPSATHFAVVKSTPTANQSMAASPKRIQMWFSQSPAEGVSQLKLLAADKADIVVGKTVVDKATKSMYADIADPLKAGAYVVSWRAAGDDGHVQTGEIKFKVAPKAGAPF